MDQIQQVIELSANVRHFKKRENYYKAKEKTFSDQNKPTLARKYAENALLAKSFRHRLVLKKAALLMLLN